MAGTELLMARWLTFGGAAAAVSVGLLWLMQALVAVPLPAGSDAANPTIVFMPPPAAEDPAAHKRRVRPEPRPPRAERGVAAPRPPRLGAAIDREALLHSRPDFRAALAAPQLALRNGPPGGDPGIGGIGGLIPRFMIQPLYPRRALLRGIEGEVVVEFTVDFDGAVIDARVVAAEPPHVFDRESVAAVYKWRFQPVRVDGEPARITARQTIGFTVVDEMPGLPVADAR